VAAQLGSALYTCAFRQCAEKLLRFLEEPAGTVQVMVNISKSPAQTDFILWN